MDAQTVTVLVKRKAKFEIQFISKEGKDSLLIEPTNDASSILNNDVMQDYVKQRGNIGTPFLEYIANPRKKHFFLNPEYIDEDTFILIVNQLGKKTDMFVYKYCFTYFPRDGRPYSCMHDSNNFAGTLREKLRKAQDGELVIISAVWLKKPVGREEIVLATKTLYTIRRIKKMIAKN
jgi:hypothetical protein